MAADASRGEVNADTVAESLADAIHQHRLRPGTKLSEDEVGEVYGVSRTLVRAALRRLAHDHLVTLHRNRGAFVAQPTAREAREVFEARALLEPRTAHSAAERATPADIARLEAHIAAEHAALDRGETGRALRLSGQFHIDIAEIADQATICEIVTSLVALLVAGHRALLAALHRAVRDPCPRRAAARRGGTPARRGGSADEEPSDRPAQCARPGRRAAAAAVAQGHAGGAMTVRVMTSADLETVLDWAAAEGWNPGLDDAAPFRAADPEGFFVAARDGAPVAAISVVNHDAANAFLGLYICRPEWRGQGIGLDLWQLALRHAGQRAVGLDGVEAQQANYASSGFVRTGATRRWEGPLPPAPPVAGLRAATPGDLDAIARLDRAANGYARAAFLRAWLHDSATRRTLVLAPEGAPEGFVTIRRCRSGCKIGPVTAADCDAALALIHGAAAAMAAATVTVDVPDANGALSAALAGRGLRSSFATARMVRGIAPVAGPLLQAVATLELG